jgi:hypothetical protein
MTPISLKPIETPSSYDSWAMNFSVSPAVSELPKKMGVFGVQIWMT